MSVVRDELYRVLEHSIADLISKRRERGNTGIDLDPSNRRLALYQHRRVPVALERAEIGPNRDRETTNKISPQLLSRMLRSMVGHVRRL